jgi:hypothetical protein
MFPASGKGRSYLGDWVSYRHDHALAVDLVLSAQRGPDTGRGRRYLHLLSPSGSGWFTGSLPPEATSDELLVMLLSLRSGRVAWGWWPLV